MKRNEIKKLALSAIICALSVVVIILGCVIDVIDLTACAVASGAVAFACIELRGKYPYLIYGVTSALALILFPGCTASIYYVIFMGYYPIIKRFLEKIPGIFCLIGKLAAFNAALGVIALLSKFLFISEEATTGTALIVTIIIFANIFFVVFDMALTVITTAYLKHFRKKWGIGRFLD